MVAIVDRELLMDTCALGSPHACNSCGEVILYVSPTDFALRDDGTYMLGFCGTSCYDAYTWYRDEDAVGQPWQLPFVALIRERKAIDRKGEFITPIPLWYRLLVTWFSQSRPEVKLCAMVASVPIAQWEKWWLDYYAATGHNSAGPCDMTHCDHCHRIWRRHVSLDLSPPKEEE